ncbi:putative F-box/LRR-repeat protein 23 [Salvia miltiorrhiza]|uniref:putative F-box/LRR-repeat protein 23 n=1 Tax=Salvia miltiorrhiza TaxID=226208 RepID=UPI0025ABAC1D|nr:putative F-box/LRR-repeat protein 23 [Salvia miltiorrhiza]XP_057763927.1 putative F-box/LRR-repeat protein 23 [Salvia miltiorrhiza]
MERRKCRKIPLLRVMRFPTAKERRKSRNRKRRLQRKTPAPAASSSASPPPWIELPEDVTVNILQRLGAEGMLSAELVCSSWWKVCKDPAMWRVIDLCNPDPGATNLRRKYTAMCRRAVDRSQGQLVDLTMDSFGNGHLIKYVAHRSRDLKRLKLVSCIHIAGCLLVQAVEKLGQLEELHLNTSTWISAHHIEAIGNACPKLKSFSFSEDGSWCQLPPYLENGGIDDKSDWNRYARAIGKCMPNLHHLQLCSCLMQNEGLAAILDGCPRLESLDIRQCFGLDLEGDLGKRCREQIKDMRLTDGPGLFNFVYDYL